MQYLNQLCYYCCYVLKLIFFELFKFLRSFFGFHLVDGTACVMIKKREKYAVFAFALKNLIGT